MSTLAQLIEPHTGNTVPLLHLFAIVMSLAWAKRAQAARAAPRGAWRLAMYAAGFAAAGDVLLVISAWSTGLAILAFTVGFILGLSLLLLSLLQGWPNKALLAIAGLAVGGAFVLWW